MGAIMACRDDDGAHAFANQQQIFFGRVVTGRENEVIFGHHRDDFFGFGQKLSITRDGYKPSILFREANLRLRIEG